MIPTAQYTASPINPGTAVSILDNGAKANNDNSFRGFVLFIDIRNVAWGILSSTTVLTVMLNPINLRPQVGSCNMVIRVLYLTRDLRWQCLMVTVEGSLEKQ